ncbi:MAG: hypothetical protein NC110_05985 [Ruminococcus sp.]|nr:hypothetical protein [Ruminococcus sp.]
MKKIVAVFLAFMILALFAACGDKNNDTNNPSMLLTDVPLLSSTPSQPNINVSAGATQSSGGNSSPTMILTTQRGQVMPTVVTTNFVPDPAVAAQQSSTAPNFNLTVPSAMTAPVVYTSNTPTQKPSTTKATTKATEAEDDPAEDEPTEKPVAIPQVVDVFADGSEGSSYVLTFSPDDWGSGIKSNAEKIAVTVEGSDLPRVAWARVSSSKNIDGDYSIIIDAKDFKDGDVIKFTIPERFIESKDGTAYSSAFTMNGTITTE